MADSTFSIGGGGGLSLFGAISGAGFGIIKADVGTLSLSGANTYTGATTISAGKLALNPTTSIAASSGVDVAGPAMFEVRSSKTIAALTGTGSTVLLGAPVTLTIGDARDISSTYDGVISGPGGLAKAGAGTLTLTGANTYDGATNINAGALVAANATALGSTTGGTVVAAGASLVISSVSMGAEAVTLNGGNGVVGNGICVAARGCDAGDGGQHDHGGRGRRQRFHHGRGDQRRLRHRQGRRWHPHLTNANTLHGRDHRHGWHAGPDRYGEDRGEFGPGKQC